ncbi:MAG: DsbA family protein, partial [Burkholderiales bacterium]
MAAEHVLGSGAAGFTLVEYGSYNCPFCQSAHEVLTSLRDRFGERMRYEFRHRPITGDENALQAAELAEYAHETADRFWEVH